MCLVLGIRSQHCALLICVTVARTHLGVLMWGQLENLKKKRDTMSPLMELNSWLIRDSQFMDVVRKRKKLFDTLQFFLKFACGSLLGWLPQGTADW